MSPYLFNSPYVVTLIH